MKHRLLAPLTAFAFAGTMLVQGGVSTSGVTALAANAPDATAKTMRLSPVSAQTLNLNALPAESRAQFNANRPGAMPLLRPGGAVHGTPQAGQLPVVKPVTSTPSNKGPGTGFDGMADSGKICPYFGTGCQPPDMALATSNNFVFQGVNTSFAIYTPGGRLVHGPVTAQQFFHVPNPQPAGCDPAGPFLSDPRAFYDPNDHLFWASVIQIENALGLSPNCAFSSKVWVANLDPTTGVIHSYNFDTSLGFNNINDYTQLGFNSTTVANSFNMFTQDGSAYAYAESLFYDKHTMEMGGPVTPVAVYDYVFKGVVVDTVNPVETPIPNSADPGVEYSVNSYNSPDAQGHDCVTMACHGFVVWAFDPASGTVTGKGVSGAGSLPYLEPPGADQPGCSGCIETLDTRISGTPVYSIQGSTPLISFAHETGVNNGSQMVAAVQWGQITPSLTGKKVTTAAIYQAGYEAFAGDQVASFGAMMPDNTGKLYMVFDTMSNTLNPSIELASRLPTDPLGTLGTPSIIKYGLTATLDTRWGDYEATSYTGNTSNHVWVASQYSGANQDWSTFIYQAQ